MNTFYKLAGANTPAKVKYANDLVNKFNDTDRNIINKSMKGLPLSSNENKRLFSLALLTSKYFRERECDEILSQINETARFRRRR